MKFVLEVIIINHPLPIIIEWHKKNLHILLITKFEVILTPITISTLSGLVTQFCNYPIIEAILTFKTGGQNV